MWSHMISEKRIFLFRIVLYPNAPTSCWMMPEISCTRSNIRRIGPKHCILSSDLGQANNPLHPDGWVAYIAGLLKEGISQADIDLMAKTNPAHALGLK